MYIKVRGGGQHLNFYADVRWYKTLHSFLLFTDWKYETLEYLTDCGEEGGGG